MLRMALRAVAGPCDAVYGPTLIGNRKTETRLRRQTAQRTKTPLVRRGKDTVALCASVTRNATHYSRCLLSSRGCSEILSAVRLVRKYRLALARDVEIGRKGR